MAEKKKGQHPRHPRQWLRSESDEDPYRTCLRTEFLAALHSEAPRASEKVIDTAGAAFEALVDHLEGGECHRLGDMPWWSLSALLTEPTPERELADAIATHLRIPKLHGDKPSRTEDEVNVLAHVLAGLQADEPCDCSRLASVLNDRLLEWADLYHLQGDAWVPEHVFGALQMHYVEGVVLKTMADPPEPFCLGIWTPRLPNYAAPRFPSTLGLRPYQPDRETRDDFKARVEVYADRVERFDKATRHSVEARYHPDRDLHLRRLVRYHCLGQTYAEVAGSDHLEDPSSARRSIKALYGDLPLNTPRPRPPRRKGIRK